MLKEFYTYGISRQLGNKSLRTVNKGYPLSDPTQECVIKIFDASCLNHTYEYETFLERSTFIKQIEHTHLVPILDMGIEKERLYVVTPYISGPSLFERQQQSQGTTWNITKAIALCIDLGQTLSYMHACGIVHANVKPGNILFDEQGNVLLTDFSLTGLIDENKLGYASDPQSISYMAPEQDLGQHSEEIDQYALACIGYELLTGELPFRDPGLSLIRIEHITARPIRPSKLISTIPTQVDQVFLRALATDPAERYASMAAFVDALQIVSSLISSRQHTDKPSTFDEYGKEGQTASIKILDGTVHHNKSHASNNVSTDLPAMKRNDESGFPGYESQIFPEAFHATPARKPPIFPFSSPSASVHKKLQLDLAENGPDTPAQVATISPGLAKAERLVATKDSEPLLSVLEITEEKVRQEKEEPNKQERVANITNMPMLLPTPPTSSQKVEASFRADARQLIRIRPGDERRNIPSKRRTRFILLFALLFALAGLLSPYLQDIFQNKQVATPPITFTPAALPSPPQKPDPTKAPVPTTAPTEKPTATPMPTPTPTLTAPPTQAPPVATTAPTTVPTSPPVVQLPPPPTTQPTPASTSSVPIGKSIWLRASVIQNYIAAWGSSSNKDLRAQTLVVEVWEVFDVVDAGNGKVALRAYNGKYVSAWLKAEHTPLWSVIDTIGVWESFYWVTVADGVVAFMAAANNLYVSARQDQQYYPLCAMSTEIKSWEKFEWGIIE